MRYSCAIGGCNEKTYSKSTGVKFFHVKNFVGEQQIAVKTRILNTRKDLKNIGQIKDYVICSRHFPGGDKTKKPSLIPKIVGEEIVWPKSGNERKAVIRNNKEDPIEEKDDTQTKTGDKLMSLIQACSESPDKVVGVRLIPAYDHYLCVNDI